MSNILHFRNLSMKIVPLFALYEEVQQINLHVIIAEFLNIKETENEFDICKQKKIKLITAHLSPTHNLIK